MTVISGQPLVSTIYDRLLIEDDTEESVSGSDYHLAAIFALYEVLLRYSQRAIKRWYVTAEVLVLADIPDRVRNPWRAMPDVYVVLDTEDAFRTSLDTRAGESFPQFICEVASDSTWAKDVVEKRRVYADLGALEYIVFDPTTAFLGRSLQAWRRLPDSDWATWMPDADGFLISTALDGLRLRAEGTLLRVYDPTGERLPTGQELDAIARERAARQIEAQRVIEEQAVQQIEAQRVIEEQAVRQREARRVIEEQAVQQIEAQRVIEEQAARLAEVTRRMAELEEQLARLHDQGQAGG